MLTITPPDAFAPATLGPVTLRNRIFKAATFEAMTPEGLVTDKLIDFHRRSAAGGVGATTVSYLAVSQEGTGAPAEIWLRDEALPGLRTLTEAIKKEGAAASAQLGHAGAVGGILPGKRRPLGPSRGISPMMAPVFSATEDDLRRVTRDFADGARRIVDSGFDIIEVHLGHNYLLSAFMSPRWNKRKDRYGGSVENRTRLAREVLRAVRDAAGDSVAVIAKMNMEDGVPGGIWLDQSIPAAQLIESDGTLDAIEFTVGSSLANPMYLFRGEVPWDEITKAAPAPMKAALKTVGGKFLRDYPFEEAFLLPYAREFRRALALPLILLGGINKRETIDRAMVEGFDFVAMGRALLREPDLVNKMAAGASNEALCVHCNRCMPTIYSERGTHCVLAVALGEQ